MKMTAISTRIEDGQVIELPTDGELDVSAFRSGQWPIVWLQASAPDGSDTAEYAVSINQVSDGEQFDVPEDYDYGYQIHLRSAEYLVVTLTEVGG